MLVEKLINKIRIKVRDEHKEEFPDNEIIDTINESLTQINLKHIQLENPDFIKELIFTGGNEELPEGFIKFIGQYPVYIESRKIKSYYLLDDSLILRFYCAIPHVSSKFDEVDLREPYIADIIVTATKLLYNKNEFNVSQDDRDLSGYNQVLAGVLNGSKQ